MGIVAAKCSECGASLEINDARKEGFCPFCGTKYVTQDIIQHTVNNNYVTQNIASAVFQGGDTVETLYGRFDAFCRIGDEVSARNVAETMCKKYPQKAVSWYCAAVADRAREFERFDLATARLDSRIGGIYLPDPASLFESKKWQTDQQFRETIQTTHDEVLHKREIVAQDMQSVVQYTAPEIIRRDFANAQKFLTDADRATYGDLIRKAEEGLAECEQRYIAFQEHAAAAAREVQARVDAWEAVFNRLMGRKNKRRTAKNVVKTVLALLVAGAAIYLVVALILSF